MRAQPLLEFSLFWDASICLLLSLLPFLRPFHLSLLPPFPSLPLSLLIFQLPSLPHTLIDYFLRARLWAAHGRTELNLQQHLWLEEDLGSYLLTISSSFWI